MATARRIDYNYSMFKIIKLVSIGLGALLIVTIISFVSGIGENPKDQIISVYDSILQSFDTAGLTKDRDLQGTRRFATDKYTGTYTADYDNYTGTENIFGGTALNRKQGNHVKLKINISQTGGEVKVIKKLGNEETVLLSGAGQYNDEINVEGASYYLTLQLENFRGKVEIKAE